MKNLWQHILCRTHEILFTVLLFSLPVQLGKHWWPSYSFVLGRRIDYLSPTLYFTDILLMLVVLFGLIQNKSIRAYFFSRKTRMLFAIVGCLLVITILTSTLPSLSAYKALKIYELLMFITYIRGARPSYSSVTTLLAGSVTLISVLAIVQFFHQSAVGGIFWFIGERWFTASTPGIAQAVLDGQLVLRPYSTFPHPNVLAGFLVVALSLLYAGGWTTTGQRYIHRAGFLLGCVAVILTMSRTAWLAGILAVIAGNVLHSGTIIRKLSWWQVIVAIVGAGFFARLLFLRIAELWLFDAESIAQRFVLIQSALSIFWRNPLFGVGLQAFIPALPTLPSVNGYLLQPVHNVYLLMLAETGLVGFVATVYGLGYILNRLVKGRATPLLISFIALLIISCADHYFFMLQQTQLLAALVIALSLLPQSKN